MTSSLPILVTGAAGDIGAIGRNLTALLIDRSWPGFEEHLTTRLRWGTEPGHFRALSAVSVPLPGALRSPREDDWPGRLGETRVPVLLVRGADDVLLQPDWSDHMAAASPRVEVVEVPGRHSPNIDAAATLWPVLRDFLARAGSDG